MNALYTSKNSHYLTPPEVVRPMRRLLVPVGSGRSLGDFFTNHASIVGANYIADGVEADGLSCRWSIADTWFKNPPYGTEIARPIETAHYWGRECGMPGITLVPNRSDTRWMQGETWSIHSSADAWIEVAGRLTFWLPIPLTEAEAPEPEKKVDGKYYLQRWFPDARVVVHEAVDEWSKPVVEVSLPEPFRRSPNGLIVGPELGKNGKPQSAPFPSLIGFWADGDGRFEGDHPITIREFARCFGHMGTLVVARGEHRGAYPLQAMIAEAVAKLKASGCEGAGLRALVDDAIARIVDRTVVS